MTDHLDPERWPTRVLPCRCGGTRVYVVGPGGQVAYGQCLTCLEVTLLVPEKLTDKTD